MDIYTSTEKISMVYAFIEKISIVYAFIFVVILNLIMAIFGFLMFSGGKSSGETKIISIV